MFTEPNSNVFVWNKQNTCLCVYTSPIDAGKMFGKLAPPRHCLWNTYVHARGFLLFVQRLPFDCCSYLLNSGRFDVRPIMWRVVGGDAMFGSECDHLFGLGLGVVETHRCVVTEIHNFSLLIIYRKSV